MNKLIQCNTFLIFIIFLSGCFSYAPSDNYPFAKIKRLKQLNGIYQNRGIDEKDHLSTPNTKRYYLSKIIWVKDEKMNHKAIDIIQIKTISDNKLSIKALNNNRIVKEKIFLQGTDFSLSSGKIQLANSWGVPLPIVGVGHVNNKLGLDQRKNGKYKKETMVCGLFALLLPMFFKITEEIRFQRINNRVK